MSRDWARPGIVRYASSISGGPARFGAGQAAERPASARKRPGGGGVLSRVLRWRPNKAAEVDALAEFFGARAWVARHSIRWSLEPARPNRKSGSWPSGARRLSICSVGSARLLASTHPLGSLARSQVPRQQGQTNKQTFNRPDKLWSEHRMNESCENSAGSRRAKN